MTDTGARAASRAPPGGDPPRPRGDGQRRQDVPLLRDHAPGLLQVAAAVRGGRGRRPCGTAPRARTRARTPRRPRSWARSSTCARPTTSGRTRSRCTSSGTTSSELSPSGIWRILKRLDMSRLPASQRYVATRTAGSATRSPSPGSRVQIDVKFIAPLPGSRRKHYQYTAIDDCTRIRVLRVYDRCTQATSIRFLDEVLARLPFRVETIQTDNGAEFQSAFHYHVLDRGHRPRLHQASDPAAQRQGRALAPDRRRRVLQAPRRRRDRQSGLFAERLRSGRTTTTSTPHGGLGGQTPYERLRQKTGATV